MSKFNGFGAMFRLLIKQSWVIYCITLQDQEGCQFCSIKTFENVIPEIFFFWPKMREFLLCVPRHALLGIVWTNLKRLVTSDTETFGPFFYFIFLKCFNS